jgi:preprotein translocase subunit SecA
MTVKLLKQKALEKIERYYEKKEQELTPEFMREIERMVLLRVVDEKWMDHIDAMDELRHGISMRAYAQRDPVIEYKFEGFDMFEQMTSSISQDALSLVLRTPFLKKQDVKRERVAEPLAEGQDESAQGGFSGNNQNGRGRQGGPAGGARGGVNAGARVKGVAAPQAPARRMQKAGRNDPCPCGSGKKYKNCHGNVA